MLNIDAKNPNAITSFSGMTAKISNELRFEKSTHVEYDYVRVQDCSVILKDGMITLKMASYNKETITGFKAESFELTPEQALQVAALLTQAAG